MQVKMMNPVERFQMKITDFWCKLNGNETMVAGQIWPKEISDEIGHDDWVESRVRQVMLKSSRDGNWYTVIRKAILKADEPLAKLCDMILERNNKETAETMEEIKRCEANGWKVEENEDERI